MIEVFGMTGWSDMIWGFTTKTPPKRIAQGEHFKLDMHVEDQRSVCAHVDGESMRLKGDFSVEIWPEKKIRFLCLPD